VLALAAAVAAAAPAATTPSAKQLVLRLSDVPGYAISRTGPDDTCSAPVFVSDVAKDVLRLLRASWHDGCNLMATLYIGRLHCRTDLMTDQPVAIVQRTDVVLMIGCSDCYAVRRGYYPLKRYGSPAAVRAIVRALRLREPRPSATP